MRGDQQLTHAAGDELVLDRNAVDLDLEERTDHVCGRVERAATALEDQVPALGVETLVRCLCRLGVEVRRSVLEALTQRVQLLAALPADVQEAGEDEPREARCHFRHELATAPSHERLEQLPG